MPRVSEELKEAKKTLKTKEKEKKTLSKTVEKLKSKHAKNAAKHRADAEKIRARAKAFHEKADAMHAKKMAKLEAMYEHAKHLDLLAHAEERASKAKSNEDLDIHIRDIGEHLKRIAELKESMKHKKADEPKVEEVKEEKVEIVIPEVKTKKAKEFPVKALEGLRAVEAETKERNVRRKGEAKEREMRIAEDVKPISSEEEKKPKKGRMVKGSEEAKAFGERMKALREKKAGEKVEPAKKEDKPKSEKKKKPEAVQTKSIMIPFDIDEFKKGLRIKHKNVAIENANESFGGDSVDKKDIEERRKLAIDVIASMEKKLKKATKKDEPRLKETLKTSKVFLDIYDVLLDYIEHA